jgi:hypothetical protein
VGGSPFTSPVVIEVSTDGVHWTNETYGRYSFLPDPTQGAGPFANEAINDFNAFGVPFNERQWAFTGYQPSGPGTPFRFLRLRDPLSAAQGLSGYLDNSEAWVFVGAPQAVPTPVATAGIRSWDCSRSQVMEDFFSNHPCTFGGIDRYDAASDLATYFLGDGVRLTRLTGRFTIAPWRADDWYTDDAAGNDTRANVTVQVSLDGTNWTNVASTHATYGVPTVVSVDLGPRVGVPATGAGANASLNVAVALMTPLSAPAKAAAPAGVAVRFVRFLPECQHDFFEYNNPGLADLHHTKAYFLQTQVTVSGSLPAP